MKDKGYTRFLETQRVRELLISGLEGTYALEIEIGDE